MKRALAIAAVMAIFTLPLAARGQTISQPLDSGGGYSGNVGQSFTATVTGVVTTIRVRSLFAGPVTLQIYNGAVGSGIPGSAGTPAYTQAVTLTAAGGGGPFSELVLTTPFPVTAGQAYSFVISTASLFSRAADVYAGGTLLTNFATPQASSDMAFEVVQVAPAVTTFSGPSATGSGTVTASFTGGGITCTFSSPQLIPVVGDPRSPPAGTAPAVFPHGLFDFSTTGCTPGSTITMTITYPSALPASSRYWKYGPTPTGPAPHWYVLPATIVGNTVTFSITDGGVGDDDLAANGTIVDQGGPGLGGGSGPTVPTLGTWALLTTMLLMLGTAFRLRRRRLPG